jgi:L-lactate dehydrogenase complex protein LldE
MRVALFVTCLVDLFRPNVGFAAIKLLQDSGCEVHVPEAQTCCGQPAYNNGDLDNARAIARQVIEAFSGYDYIVAPSGSCAGMLRQHYPRLFDGDAVWHARALALAGRCHELVSFLNDVLKLEAVTARYAGSVTYHDACSGLRELGIQAQPRRLLRSVQALTLREMANTDVCCGFGGTFCVKYAEISARMADDKVAQIQESGADTLLGGDLGCLLNMGGCLKRAASPIKVYHVAEVLAGMADGPGLGDPEKKI